MKTIINYYDFMGGEYLKESESDYMNYKYKDDIRLNGVRFIVMSVLHDESAGIKIVNAYKASRED